LVNIGIAIQDIIFCKNLLVCTISFLRWKNQLLTSFTRPLNMVSITDDALVLMELVGNNDGNCASPEHKVSEHSIPGK